MAHEAKLFAWSLGSERVAFDPRIVSAIEAIVPHTKILDGKVKTTKVQIAASYAYLACEQLVDKLRVPSPRDDRTVVQ